MRITVILCLGVIICVINPLLAQQVEMPGISGAQRLQSMLPSPDLLEKFGQRDQGAKTENSCIGAANPLFTFAGPDMQSLLWTDPHLSGPILVLQGELMKKMGQILIEQGQAMLGEKSESSVGNPQKEE